MAIQRARLLAIGLASCLAACGPVGCGTYFTSGIRGYTGDGTIEDTSQRDGILSTRGYLVALPSFPLDQPFDRTFRLDGLPTIEGHPAEIAFVVPNTFPQAHAANAGSIVEFALATADGTSLTTLSDAGRVLRNALPRRRPAPYLCPLPSALCPCVALGPSSAGAARVIRTT